MAKIVSRAFADIPNNNIFHIFVRLPLWLIQLFGGQDCIHDLHIQQEMENWFIQY